ncbi:membrane-associated HD superfamily phosphohydrolase [Hydrogenophaga palleronii]|uniref:Membrane-associated HD superfamily phosphohydrolase n=1 Tax=Hydrogenophaga palleronii TaxID=65655 RepID=A0ABU1WMT8_9BURK|nr:hypothetical protein [Hydrogenophaga palleronii]MDR7150548.1 membrane-associated HD superfamily phosphohydrolase [Hydrogenophaga palleronii]
MSKKKNPFSWPQIAVLLLSAGVTLLTGAQLAMAWSAMVLLQGSASGGGGALPALVLMFLPLALVVLSAVAFVRLLISRSTLVAQVYLACLFLLYSLAAGLNWHLTEQVTWLDLLWLLMLVALFFALGRQGRSASPEQTPANG